MIVLNIFNYDLKHKILFNKLIKHLIINPTTNNLLLIQNGVYCGLYLSKLLPATLKIYALAPDVIARGLLEKFKLINNITMISYQDFVDLILKHDKNVSW